jgi:transcriptional regulator with PAS, ATPase and Fis domain
MPRTTLLDAVLLACAQNPRGKLGLLVSVAKALDECLEAIPNAWGFSCPPAHRERVVGALAAFGRAAWERRYDQAYRVGEDALQGAFDLVFGVDPRLALLLNAPPPRRLLVLGETGVGKERMARIVGSALAALSGGGEFRPVSAAEFPEALLESELFGYTKGAFTGATRDREGLLASLRPGDTLFLDELGDASLALQAKLLRVIETGEYRPLGASRTRRAEFHLVAATSLERSALHDSSRLRPDLVHRLAAGVVQLPPLRATLHGDRRDARRFLQVFIDREIQDLRARTPADHQANLDMLLLAPAALARDIARHTQGYSWPGNLRQLRSLVHRALFEGRERVPELCSRLRALHPGDVTTVGGVPGDLKAHLEATERAAYAAAAASASTIEEVARALAVTRQTAARRMARFDLRPAQD